MKILTFDYETRSEVGLEATGPWPYAEDPSTDIMCVSLKSGDFPTRFWANPVIYSEVEMPHDLKLLQMQTPEVINLMNGADIIEAHNAGFERAVTACVAIPRYKWGLNPGWEKKLRCTASRAAAMSLPRSLDKVCEVLGLLVQKDAGGKSVMLRLCAPNKDGLWNEDPADLIRLLRYCLIDSDAERGLSKVLNELTPFELKLWQLDQTINSRGIPLDMELINSSIELVKQYSDRALPQMAELTNGELESPRQVQELVAWCGRNGYGIKDAKAKTIEESLNDSNLPEKIRPVLEMRAALGKASTAKFTSMLNGASYDGRARDTLMYHGAGPGRWTGKRLQPHNYPRKSLKTKFNDNTDFYVKMIKARRLDVLEALYPTNPMDVFSACLRPAICAAPGYELMAADFNAIEGRCLAWEAGDTHIIADYLAGLDPYKRVASNICGVLYEDITSDQRQLGKIAELACGYRGGPAAAKRFGATGTDAEIRKKFITPWRNNRPATVQFWTDVEACALAAAQDEQNRSYRCRIVSFGKHGDFLYCKLPSGRLMAYYRPEVCWVGAVKFEEDDKIYKTALVSAKDVAEYELELIRVKYKKSKPAAEEEWGMVKLTVSIESCDSQSGNMVRNPIHGGVWTENITQAIARDILACAMMRLEAAGLQIVLHIHDEIVVEVPKGSANLDDYIRIMSEVPAWAPGLPLGAEGWVNKYLKKG